MRSAMRAATGAAADRIQLFSPAKVNLFLRVVKKRPDGFHELASLFQTVALGDTMDLEVLPDATKDGCQTKPPITQRNKDETALNQTALAGR